MLLTGILSALYLIHLFVTSPQDFPVLGSRFASHQPEMVAPVVPPVFPTPVMARDKSGHSHWTVSIPPYHDFPLSTEDYARLSGQCREVSARARDASQPCDSATEQPHPSCDTKDESFVDVDRAEGTGLLPAPSQRGPVKDSGHFVGLAGASTSTQPVCDTSLTFVLESPDAGLGNAMMMMWTFYGLAKAQKRAFFVEDTRWAYGRFTDVFRNPAAPSCRPPPRHYMLPCPFQAKHLVVSSVTAKDVFPGMFSEFLRDAGTGDEIRDLMGLARTGYQSLFALQERDQEYVNKRVVELRAEANPDSASAVNAPVIGLHIRHGDQHPLEYQYEGAYIPAQVFLDTAQTLVDAHYNRTVSADTARPYVTVVASDDPTVHEEPSFSHAFPAQERIRLASKTAVQAAERDHHVLHHSVDESFGWEGGFFAPMFWSLGFARKNNAKVDGSGPGAIPSEETLRLRSYVGRAYIMDLAVLAGASDNIVCAVSAMGCRLLAVMMGWEESIRGGRWVNVDGGYGWAGINWRAF